ncbi:hypothetical protein HDC90_001135 [Pedobacter sp. AK013]|nr:hypothetical protein [Pedobacter sp. AK013]
MEKEQSDIIAKQLMKEIMYDNGMVDRWHPEKYPTKWIDRISAPAGVFFDANPEILNNEDIDQMCCGELNENQTKYGSLVGYKELDEALNDYFNNH